MDRLRERWRGRHDGEREEAVQLPGRGRQELAVGREHLCAELGRPERRAADDGADLVQPEEERGDDAEVPAAAPERPEQVGVLVGARADAFAAREHDVRLEQVVDRESVLAAEVADAAAEREAADSGGRDDPARRRQAVLVRRAVDLAPGAASTDAHGARLRVDLDVLQQRQVDHDAVVDRSETGAVVAAAADGEQQVVVARERDHPCHLIRRRGPGDQRRPLVDHRVVDAARLVVLGVVGADQSTPESVELTACSLSGCADGAHALSLVWILLRDRGYGEGGVPS